MTTPPTGNDSPPPAPTPPIVASPPSADGIVVEPGSGMGPFSLGMTRAAARAIGGEAREAALGVLEIDGFMLRFSGEEPNTALESIQFPLGQAAGGMRVANAVIANNASFAEVVSVVGPCTAPQVNRGATVTPCQAGGLHVIQAGPTLSSITLEVRRAAP